MKRTKSPHLLYRKYPPSEPCSCSVCVGYCGRPGWWTVEEAERAIDAGYARRMMLEIAPERTHGVLSPAFKGNEADYALQIFMRNGCTFLHDGLCELFDTGLQPLECRFCHHLRKGKGIGCHRDLEEDWKTEAANQLIMRWGRETGLWERRGMKIGEDE